MHFVFFFLLTLQELCSNILCNSYSDAAMSAFIMAGYVIELSFCPYSIGLLTMYSIIPDKQLFIRDSEGQD